ncbi:hypothetical protein [Streptomyces sp. RKAG293]|uniref:hypothetical protein n=1 Tax=Streptomyces sp. RKAG293 TaxID=2893403 RepID=UPI002033D359|nr:hypothetical protein [Streptomyces sp. RKAG293]MCM2420271.1 hypothetical protein [Streptomyces sp. RKAG293]
MRLNGPGPLDRPLSHPAPRPAARRRPGARLPLAAVLGVVLAAGLPLLLATDAGATPSASAAAALLAPPAPAGNNQLTVTVDDGTGKVTTSRLDCGPDQDPSAGPATSGGPVAEPEPLAPTTLPAPLPAPSTLPAPLPAPATLPAPVGPARSVADSCDQLERLGGPVGPVPAGQMCSMIYGGSQTAQVTGTWHGAAVTQKYSRANGCEVARWNRMAPVLPAATGGA